MSLVYYVQYAYQCSQKQDHVHRPHKMLLPTAHYCLRKGGKSAREL